MEELIGTPKLRALKEVIISNDNLIISKARKTFSQIDLSFKDVSLQQNTKTTLALINELAFDGTFLDIFSSTPAGLISTIIDENAVVQVCWQNKDLLQNAKQSMFFNLGNNIIAKVNVYADGLHINKYELKSLITWHAKRNHLFVIPAI